MIVDAMGEPMDEYVALDWPEPQRFDTGVRGEILCIDHFGNAITNIDGDMVAGLPNLAPKVFLRGKETCPVGKFYQEVPVGQPVALIGSTGFLEIAVNGGNAATALNLKIGDPIELR